MKKNVVVFILIFIIIFLINFTSSVQINLSLDSYENVTVGNFTDIVKKSFSHISISDPKMILYTPFDIEENSTDNVYDYTNNSNDGTVIGGAIFNSTGGKYGGAYKFDAVDDYISVGTINGFTNVITLSAWIYLTPPNGGGTTGVIFSNINGVTGSNLMINDTGRVYSQVWINGSRNTVQNLNILNNYSGWHHIVYIYNGSAERIYVDNVAGTALSASGNINMSTVSSNIGKYTGTTFLFNGSIDEVMLFNRSLSTTEIAQIYNSTYPRFYATGEMNFKDINFSESIVNFTFENCSTLNGSYIQGKINDGDYQNFSGCSLNNYHISGELANADVILRFYSLNNFYSPLISGPRKNLVPHNFINFANRTTFSFPPQNYSDNCSGAGCNPTGNPIGGFVNYSRIVNPSDADYFINNIDEFLFAIEDVDPGQIIYINDSITLDFTNYETINISTSNITIASGRGNNYSKGALIIKDVKENSSSTTLFKICGSDIRLSGLRINGGDSSRNLEYHYAVFSAGRSDLTGNYYSIQLVNIGIYSNSSNLEVDNCEIYGWRSAGVSTTNGAVNNYVHHNYIHNNLHQGLGYGACASTDNNITLIIEANLFNANRHSIASSYHNNSYEARYNLNLDEKTAPNLDRHGEPRYAGNYTILHHNSVYSIDGSCSTWAMVHIRGSPTQIDGAQIYNNFFNCNSLVDAVYVLNTTVSHLPVEDYYYNNVSVYDNVLNSSLDPNYIFPIVSASADDYEVSINQLISFNSISSSSENSIRYSEWDFSDNSSLVYGDSVTHSFSSPGRYKVKLTVSDEKGLINSTYLNIIVHPSDSSKAYLNFWIYEVSFVDSPEYVQKQAIVDGEIIWRENFSDNFSGLNQVNVEIPSYLISDNMANISLGVVVLNNYTDPLYPNVHEIEFFEVYYDAVSILYGGNETVGSMGDFENGTSTWVNLTNTTSWVNDTSWENEVNGKYSYKIAPVYRGNYTAGTFVGISKNFDVIRLSSSELSTNSENSNPGRVVFNPSKEEMKEGYKNNFRKSYILRFYYKDEIKEVEIISVKNNSVEIIIDSKKYRIENNSSKKVDLDKDGYYDLDITVSSIELNGIANIEFKLINEKINPENEEGDGPIIKVFKDFKLYYYILGIIILLLIWFRFKIYKNR